MHTLSVNFIQEAILPRLIVLAQYQCGDDEIQEAEETVRLIERITRLSGCNDDYAVAARADLDYYYS